MIVVVTIYISILRRDKPNFVTIFATADLRVNREALRITINRLAFATECRQTSEGLWIVEVAQAPSDGN